MNLELVTQIQGYLAQFGFKILGAIVIMVVGIYAAKFVTKLLDKGLKASNIDPTLAGFARNLLYYAIIAFVAMAALNSLGVATTSFVAVLGAAGLAIGLATEGALSNFAAGVLIIFFRPFRIGDYVEIADVEGTIEDIQIFNTVLNSLDNETIIIPNSQITSEKITNYSTKDYVRVEVPFTIGYDADLKTVNDLVLQVPEHCPRILEEPIPELQVIEFTERGLKVQVEFSVKGPDREDAGFEAGRAVKLLLDEAGIKFPYQPVTIIQG